MSFNIFDWIIGNPINKQADAKYSSALKALKAARARHDRAAERKALADMRAAAQASKAQADKVIAKVAKVDHALASSASKTRKMMIAGGLLAVVIIAAKVLRK